MNKMVLIPIIDFEKERKHFLKREDMKKILEKLEKVLLFKIKKHQTLL